MTFECFIGFHDWVLADVGQKAIVTRRRDPYRKYRYRCVRCGAQKGRNVAKKEAR